MNVLSETGMSAIESVRTSPDPGRERAPAETARFALGVRWGAALVALTVLALLHPPIRPFEAAPLWVPAAGVGLVLVAWYGAGVAAGVLAAHAGLRMVFALTGSGEALPVGATLACIAADTALTLASALTAWWCFFQVARGHRRLLDPNSATLFVLLVPGLVPLLATVPRAWWTFGLLAPDLDGLSPGLYLVRLWLGQALGILVLAPPLLTLLTPRLKRYDLLSPERLADQYTAPRAGTGSAGTRPGDARSIYGGRASAFGDWIEITGLTCAATILCLVLTSLHARGEMLGWQLWGVQLLLIVWAGLRQGLRGGTVVAASATLTTLLIRQVLPQTASDPLFVPLLQAHLAAQCAAALLVAVGASWVRIYEASYRQVVSQVPVVLYSARLRPGTEGEPAAAPGSDRRRPPHFGGLASRRAEVTLVSAGSLDLLGCPAEELLGDYRHWLSRVHPDDHIVIQAALEQLSLQDTPLCCEYRLLGGAPAPADPAVETVAEMAPSLLPPPRVRWLRDTLAPSRDASGRLIGWEGVVTDISEQRYLADDLRRTTSMFHTLVAHLPAGVFFVQAPYGQPILVNARARQLLGQREDAAAGLDYLSRVYRLYRADGSLYPAEELPVYLAIREGRTTMRDDIIVHRPDGRRIPLVTWAAPIQLNPRSQTADAAVWVLEDLTALRQAEAARQQSEGQLRAIIETMAEGLLVHDTRDVIVSCNQAAAAFFGLPAEQICGRSLFERAESYLREDGSPLPRDEHPFRLALRSGQPVRHVVVGVQTTTAPTAPPRWLLVNAMPLGQPPGGPAARSPSPAGVVTTFADITAYVQAREGIQTSEERYRGLVESLPLMLVQTDRSLRLTYANPAVKQISGYALEEVADPTVWAAAIHADDRERMVLSVRNAVLGQSDRTELRYQARDGSEKVALAWLTPLLQHGSSAGATLLLVDITRQRHLEKELQRSQSLELIGRLTSGIAHDFNNLLAVVLGLTELAQAHLPAEHPVTADLQRIITAGEQAAGLAGQLLALSKQRPAPSRRIDLNRMVRRTLELIGATLRQRVQIETCLSDDQPHILADETRVQQVLMNLCLNARDAMPLGGVLQVLTRVEPGSPTGRRVCLAVTDTGQGMSEDVCRRIFEPFFSTKEGGTGLGLAVVQQIVESYGGQIEVSSQPGQGTRFAITWPPA